MSYSIHTPTIRMHIHNTQTHILYYTHTHTQVSTDCIWSDPASEEMETILDETGFGDSPRGGGAVCFGNAAIENFLAANNLSYIIRLAMHHTQYHNCSHTHIHTHTHIPHTYPYMPLIHTCRAHEAHAYGVSLSKGARVFTVFSTSKDHRQGEKAMAGCILIDNEKIQV
ncbi:hypothetical protein EON63_07180 [archaeon]|nr:MAG: hypothetical protein EON63_07180 [archaeon]